jgi:NAD(P)-dependent dehydrogenase (short-subunit alcohol dehydrogenase family)
LSHPKLDITGRIALVTGGTSGLGRAIALGLAEAGVRVFAGSRDTGRVDAARDALKAISPNNEAISLDVTDPASIKAAVDTVVKTAGRLDILVNAAGVTNKASAEDVTLEDWERVIRVNLTGTFLASQAAARQMIKQGEGGSIINIASLGSFMGLSYVSAYCASKAGVKGLTQVLAIDWAEHNIRVNAIAPGVFPTSLNRPLIEGTPRGEWLQRHAPMNRFGDGSELVGAAVYLASPAASFVTGTVMPVDGGFLATAVPAIP